MESCQGERRPVAVHLRVAGRAVLCALRVLGGFLGSALGINREDAEDAEGAAMLSQKRTVMAGIAAIFRKRKSSCIFAPLRDQRFSQ